MNKSLVIKYPKSEINGLWEERYQSLSMYIRISRGGVASYGPFFENYWYIFENTWQPTMITDVELLLGFSQSISPTTSKATTPTKTPTGESSLHHTRKNQSPRTHSQPPPKPLSLNLTSNLTSNANQPKAALGSPWSGAKKLRRDTNSSRISRSHTTSSSFSAFRALETLAAVANAGNVSKKEKKKIKSVSEQVLRDATSTTTMKTKTKPKTTKEISINGKKRKAEKHNDKRMEKIKKKKKKNATAVSTTLTSTKKILLAPRPTTTTTATTLLPPANHLADLINSVPALRLRLRALEFMFWSQLFPLLATHGWEHVPATSAAAEVFVPGRKKNKKKDVRLRSIFETLCYLSSPGGVSSNQMVCHLVRSLLEQRRLIACVSMTVQQQQQQQQQEQEQQKGMQKKEEEKQEKKERVRRERVQELLQQQRSTVEVIPSNGKKEELSSSCSPLGMKLMRMGNL